MRRFLLPAVILPALLLTGCGAPKLDASSEATLKASAEKILATLDEPTKDKFQEALGAVMAKATFGNFGDEAKMRQAIKDALDGKTADEVIAAGEKAKAESAEQMKKLMNG